MPVNHSTIRRDIESVVNGLHVRFGAAVALATIAAEVEREFARYSNARVTDFVPILVERGVQSRLHGRGLS
jgi:hypothetical protein